MEQSSPLLFVLYDAGETHALEPVWELLDWQKADYQILALATAKQLCAQHPRCLPCTLSPEHGERLDDTTLHTLLDLARPRTVLTGLVSVAQHQLASTWRKQGCRIIGYYDAFQRIQEASIAHTFLDLLHELYVPAQEIKRELGPQSCLVRVVGQPSLERWAALMRPPSAREHPQILCVGGYGEDYHLALPRMLAAVSEFPDCCFRIAVHPKVSGDYERDFLEQHGLSNVELVAADSSTLEAACESELILCHRSTVGVQAAWLGIPVIYCDLPGASYSNLAIENGVVAQVKTYEALVSAIALGLKVGRRPPMEFFQQLGIPLGASREILRLLLSPH